jgi:uncharacterized membrane protein YfcA
MACSRSASSPPSARSAAVGLPAALGAVVGTGVQQRLTGRALGPGFAALLVVVGVLLLV